MYAGVFRVRVRPKVRLIISFKVYDIPPTYAAEKIFLSRNLQPKTLICRDNRDLKWKVFSSGIVKQRRNQNSAFVSVCVDENEALWRNGRERRSHWNCNVHKRYANLASIL